jgi:hypothetical protein
MLLVPISVLCSKQTNQPPNLGVQTNQPPNLGVRNSRTGNPYFDPTSQGFPMWKTFHARCHIRYSRLLPLTESLLAGWKRPFWFNPRGGLVDYRPS